MSMITLFYIFSVLGFIASSAGVILLLIGVNDDYSKGKTNGLIVAIMGIVLILISGMQINNIRNSEAELQEFIESASRTTATIIDTEPVTNLFGGTIGYRIIAEAEINGTRHIIRSSLFSNNPIHEFPIGSTITALFDPLDPSNNRIDMDELAHARIP
ncbi:MAG: DUF3592 domain-containing protein [Oscillospiraceae bacterium]|nr:DUF3592 domain-containing protein [Oscillospiraceae bacterium]MCL2277912.1 DUF3592 domain-containing protein [Oscillospiraceae bacterium]